MDTSKSSGLREGIGAGCGVGFIYLTSNFGCEQLKSCIILRNAVLNTPLLPS
jgi:hypothetical protein